jgi:hypothetical protein
MKHFWFLREKTPAYWLQRIRSAEPIHPDFELKQNLIALEELKFQLFSFIAVVNR